jgi:hypothetical protein
VLDTITRPTDETVALFDRAVGRMFRRAETRERDALLRGPVTTKLCILAIRAFSSGGARSSAPATAR